MSFAFKYLICIIISVLSVASTPRVGQVIDYLNNVPVYYNGKVGNVCGRNVTYDGYNLGLKWQCVEFVKRYYYEFYNHKMPNSYGDAKHFFDKRLDDVAFNKTRGLMQYRNTREERPEVGDILVYDGEKGNPYGHIGILGEVGDDYVVLYQQNMGKKSRQRLKLVEYKGIYTIADFNILGWLRKVD